MKLLNFGGMLSIIYAGWVRDRELTVSKPQELQLLFEKTRN